MITFIDDNHGTYGVEPICRGALYLMLQNRIHRGEICHKGKAYLGEHGVIMEQVLFDQVGALLAFNRNDHSDAHNGETSLLIHKVWDGHGRRMRPNHASKKGRRYRYYASDNREARLKERCYRVPAGDLEAIVLTQLRTRLDPESGPTSLLTLDTAPLSEQR